MCIIRSIFAAMLGVSEPRSKTKLEESLDSAPLADVVEQASGAPGQLPRDIVGDAIVDFDATPSRPPRASGCVLLIRSDGRVAAVPRKGNYADMSLPGGKQEHRDLGDLAITAARELFEETGLSVPAKKLRRLHAAVDIDGYLTVTFMAHESDVISAERTEESDAMRWVEPLTLLGGTYDAYNAEVLRKAGL